MRRNDKVELYKYDKNKVTMNEFGTRIPAPPDLIKPLKGDMQPYSTELLLKNYGYDIKCTKRFFCDNDNQVDIGLFLKYEEKFYKIVEIIPWKKHMEVILDEWDLNLK